ncbi:MAG: nitroreductase family protein [Chlorobi bacterium]|nr:nitroreductase family protein [Chlorobiota bacterium]
MLKDLMLKSRSYRRFYQEYKVSENDLVELVELTRYSPSARNAQPLKYFLSCDEKTNAKIFPTLAWAGYLTDWPGPEDGERPSAYIVMLLDTGIADNQYCDDGIAIQSILLGATEKGLGGCTIAAIDKKRLRTELNIPERFEILYVLAIGKPKEKVVIEDMKDNDFKYWRDSDGIHHVPKRSINEIIL